MEVKGRLGVRTPCGLVRRKSVLWRQLFVLRRSESSQNKEESSHQPAKGGKEFKARELAYGKE